MNGEKVSKEEVERMIYLRKTGHSLPEIGRTIGRGKGTVHRYVKDVQILPKYVEILRAKQGGSKARAIRGWNESVSKAGSLILPIKRRDKFFILASLYWGEGTKRDLNIINSDPFLIKTFVSCLYELGITKEQLRITIRIYEDMNKEKSIRYWANVLGVSEDKILNVNILHGKKNGKLEYGMCRVRVTKGEKYFKLILSMIDLIKSKI